MKKYVIATLFIAFGFTLMAQTETPAPAAEKKEKGSAFGITAGLLTPTGSYGETYGVTPHIGLRWKSSVSGWFGLFSNIPNLHNDVYLSYGLSGFSNDYKSKYKSAFGKEPDDADAGKALTAVNTIRYTFTDILPLIDPYAGVGIGVSYVLGGSPTSSLTSLSSFGYGVAFKGGAQMPLTDWFAVDANIDYIMGTFSFFNVGVSAMFTFGGKY